jgi:hypothetical protein
MIYGDTGNATSARIAAKNDAAEIGATKEELAEGIDRFEKENEDSIGS